MPIEVAVMDGSGKIELTGNLGDVMKESARTAISCVRTRAKGLDISPDFYKTKDIHIQMCIRDRPHAGAPDEYSGGRQRPCVRDPGEF